tara:strand:- start:451 stop:771 length:321 start_codon:yes stop_codon:yes gene_type:complete
MALDLSDIAKEQIGFTPLVGSMHGENIGFAPVTVNSFMDDQKIQGETPEELYSNLELELKERTDLANENDVDTKLATKQPFSLLCSTTYREQILNLMKVVHDHYIA